MPKKLKIDRAIYLADDALRTYGFLKRNPQWQKLSHQENERNKKHIDGFTRIFKDGDKKVFRA